MTYLLFYIFSRAKLLLRKKKFQEGLLQKTDAQLDTLERLVHDLEFVQIEKQVWIHVSLIFYVVAIVVLVASKILKGMKNSATLLLFLFSLHPDQFFITFVFGWDTNEILIIMIEKRTKLWIGRLLAHLSSSK